MVKAVCSWHAGFGRITVRQVVHSFACAPQQHARNEAKARAEKEVRSLELGPGGTDSAKAKPDTEKHAKSKMQAYVTAQKEFGLLHEMRRG